MQLIVSVASAVYLWQLAEMNCHLHTADVVGIALQTPPKTLLNKLHPVSVRTLKNRSPIAKGNVFFTTIEPLSVEATACTFTVVLRWVHRSMFPAKR